MIYVMLTADDEDISDDFFPRFTKSRHVFDTSWSTLGINIYTAGGVLTPGRHIVPHLLAQHLASIYK